MGMNKKKKMEDKAERNRIILVSIVVFFVFNVVSTLYHDFIGPDKYTSMQEFYADLGLTLIAIIIDSVVTGVVFAWIVLLILRWKRRKKRGEIKLRSV